MLKCEVIFTQGLTADLGLALLATTKIESSADCMRGSLGRRSMKLSGPVTIRAYPGFLVKLLTIPLLMLNAPWSYARELPKWELYVGIAGMEIPHYRGADSGRTLVLPFPYLIYRGEKLKISDEGVRDLIFDSPSVKLDISIAASLPVPSDADGARKDMPRLDPSIEIGPSLALRLWQSTRRNYKLWLSFPLRTAFSFNDFRFTNQGWIFAPYVQLKYRNEQWKTGISMGPLYADADYHNYFYEVKEEFVTASRPKYRASGGYSGSRVTLSVSRTYRRKRIGAFLRYDVLKHAVFEESPLVERDNYLALGVTVAWRVTQSAQTTTRSEDPFANNNQ